MGISEKRMDQILRCIVEQYIDSAIPVGSRIVSKIYEGHLSPASIRNVMADLEEMGLIRQPHTSAGRIPTEQGYRYYVDRLMSSEDEEEDFEIPDLDRLLPRSGDLEGAAERISHVLSELTRSMSLLFLKNVKRVSYFGSRGVDLQDDLGQYNEGGDRLFVDGASHILLEPEFRDAAKVACILRAFEEKESLVDFFSRGVMGNQSRVHIGREVNCPDLTDISVIAKEYTLDDEPVGCLGVIGPTRMKYDRTVRIVDRMADAMTEYMERIA